MEQNLKLPIIKDTKLYKKIYDLSRTELLKIIKLGIIAYENTNDQKHQWENSDFSRRLEKVQQEYSTKINNINESFKRHL